MKPLSVLLVLVAVAIIATAARGGHELPVYPS
jgi:Flp pilus assembly pilin Flp